MQQFHSGGAGLLRAAARNFGQVLSLVDPADYGWVAARLREAAVAAAADGATQLGPAVQQRLAAKAFEHLALYDLSVAQHLQASAADFPAYPAGAAAVGLAGAGGGALALGENANPHFPREHEHAWPILHRRCLEWLFGLNDVGVDGTMDDGTMNGTASRRATQALPARPRHGVAAARHFGCGGRRWGCLRPAGRLRR